jgi:mRNA interferase HicA
VKRKDLLKHLRAQGCELLREGRSHSVWVNRAPQQQASIPRHREINDYTVRSICRQLGVPEP